MKIELQFNSMTVIPQDIQEYYPNIISAMDSYPVIQKTPKRRTSKKKYRTVSVLIDEIIDSLETK